MSIIPDNTDYTDRDFDSLRARLEQLLRSVFPDWTDFQIANFGVILMEMFAFVGDVLGFYENNQGRESRIVTANQRKNLIALAKLVNFIPANNTAATTDLTVSLAAPPIADFNLSAGQIVRTAQITDPVEFQFLTGLTIPAGSGVPATVSVENSATISEDFQSDGLPNQVFELAEVPYIDDSAAITAGNGSYDQVINFLNSAAADRDFVIVVDQNDRATIKFGNGVNGEIPTGTITVSYKVGGGEIGNVEVDAISVIEGAFTDDLANSVEVSVTNAAKAAGGTNAQTIEEIRQLAPEQVRTLNRTVAREDYEINAKRLSEVARALMLTSDQDSSIAENRGILFIIPKGEPPGVPSQALKDAVLNQVTTVFPNTITFQLVVSDPIFLTINVSAKVFKKPGFTAATVRIDIETRLADFFALFKTDGTVNTDIDFGFNFKDVDGNPAGEIAWSDIFNVVRDTPSVRKIGDEPNDMALNGADDDVPILGREFPVLGTITLIDGDTGLTI